MTNETLQIYTTKEGLTLAKTIWESGKSWAEVAKEMHLRGWRAKGGKRIKGTNLCVMVHRFMKDPSIARETPKVYKSKTPKRVPTQLSLNIGQETPNTDPLSDWTPSTPLSRQALTKEILMAGMSNEAREIVLKSIWAN